MNNVGIEVLFWTILTTFLLVRVGVFKKWQKCLKWYNGYTGRGKTPVGGSKTGPADLWSGELHCKYWLLANISRVNQLTQARAGTINAGKHTRTRFSCTLHSLAICCPSYQPPIYPVTDWAEHQVVTNDTTLTDTPWYTETRESCFTFVYISLPLGWER